MSGHVCPKGNASIIGTEIRGFYDGVAYWQCRTCGMIWDRMGDVHADTSTVPHPVMGKKRLLGDFKSCTP